MAVSGRARDPATMDIERCIDMKRGRRLLHPASASKRRANVLNRPIFSGTALGVNADTSRAVPAPR